MGKYIAEQTIKQVTAADSAGEGAEVTVFGMTSEEDCADLRNSKGIDIITELETYSVHVLRHGQEADPGEAQKEYGFGLSTWDALPRAEALVAADARRRCRRWGTVELTVQLRPGGCPVLVKSCFDSGALQGQGVRVWRL